MVKPGQTSATRLLVRLWPSDYRLPGDSPVWLVMAAQQVRKDRLLGLMTGTVTRAIPASQFETADLPSTRMQSAPGNPWILLQTR